MSCLGSFWHSLAFREKSASFLQVHRAHLSHEGLLAYFRKEKWNGEGLIGSSCFHSFLKFFELENMGAENINLVTPTQFSDKIIEALNIYKPKIPVVYNTHGYEKPEILQKIYSFIDVFLPDLKFYSQTLSTRYTGKSNYFEYASKAVLLMAQKPLIFDKKGMLKSGTIVRHLVLPACVEDSKRIIDFFADNLKDRAYLNVMSQYTPMGEITDLPELSRKITKREYDSVIDYAISKGIEKMFYQKRISASEEYIPVWDY